MVKCFVFVFLFNRVTNHAWVYKMYRFKDQRIESDFIHVFTGTLQSTTK